MKKFLLISLSILLTALLLVSCGPNDQKIENEVETTISAAYSGITTNVEKGVATLRGVVESEEAKASIERVTKSVNGVKSVVNNITVKTPEPRINVNADDTLRSTINNALTTGGYSGINVSVDDGEVTLTGDVKRADLEKVMQIANEAQPKRVINQLKIK